MTKLRTKLINLRLNNGGYIPTSRKFGTLDIHDFGFTKKGESDFVYIEYTGGDFELVRYDGKAKKWLILTFPKDGLVDGVGIVLTEIPASAAA
ncbi:MAG: hypothetical protein LBT55_05325 [Clostridiaceae bacterium]|jgi:hypothetical protein|nr:hypothetical protein [Clostridiaceae bacterium]